jgi:predicted O-methyltransferase YrrM
MITTIPDEYWTGIGLLENECPWLVPEAIRRLEEIDMSNMFVLEFGAGGSTLFFARRAKEVFSFENEVTDWYGKVRYQLWGKGLNNVHLYTGLNALDLKRKYDLILIDSAGDRKPVIDLVNKMDLRGTIIVVDNYADQPAIGDGYVEMYDDPHWNGRGTMIIHNRL